MIVYRIFYILLNLFSEILMAGQQRGTGTRPKTNRNAIQNDQGPNFQNLP